MGATLLRRPAPRFYSARYTRKRFYALTLLKCVGKTSADIDVCEIHVDDKCHACPGHNDWCVAAIASVGRNVSNGKKIGRPKSPSKTVTRGQFTGSEKLSPDDSLIVTARQGNCHGVATSYCIDPAVSSVCAGRGLTPGEHTPGNTAARTGGRGETAKTADGPAAQTAEWPEATSEKTEGAKPGEAQRIPLHGKSWKELSTYKAGTIYTTEVKNPLTLPDIDTEVFYALMSKPKDPSRGSTQTDAVTTEYVVPACYESAYEELVGAVVKRMHGAPQLLILVGPHGCGKTSAVSFAIEKSGVHGYLLNAAEFNKDGFSWGINKDFGVSDEKRMYDRATSEGRDVLVLDDIHAFRRGKTVDPHLVALIDDQLEGGRSLIITSNLSSADTLARLAALDIRLESRMAGAVVVEVSSSVQLRETREALRARFEAEKVRIANLVAEEKKADEAQKSGAAEGAKTMDTTDNVFEELEAPGIAPAKEEKAEPSEHEKQYLATVAAMAAGIAKAAAPAETPKREIRATVKDIDLMLAMVGDYKRMNFDNPKAMADAAAEEKELLEDRATLLRAAAEKSDNSGNNLQNLPTPSAQPETSPPRAGSVFGYGSAA